MLVLVLSSAFGPEEKFQQDETHNKCLTLISKLYWSSFPPVDKTSLAASALG